MKFLVDDVAQWGILITHWVINYVNKSAITFIEFDPSLTKDFVETLGLEGKRKVENAIQANISSKAKLYRKTYKRRFDLNNRGKRSGCRIIYWHSRDELIVVFIYLYAKNEKENLNKDEIVKRQLEWRVTTIKVAGEKVPSDAA